MLTFSFLLMLVNHLSFYSVKQKEFSQVESKYLVDLDGKQKISVPLATYFEDARAIILETNDDCLIGDIFELQVFNGYIYL